MFATIWTITLVLTGLLLLATTYCAVVGVLAVLSGARFERCARCHRHSLIQSGVVHADGCPDDALAHVLHLVHVAGRSVQRPWHAHG